MKLYPKLIISFIVLTIIFAMASMLLNNDASPILSIVILIIYGGLLVASVSVLIVGPIVTLSQKASQLGEGNVNVDVPQSDTDEVGIIGKQLKFISDRLHKEIKEENQLSDQLVKQKDELEEQKNKLEKVNNEMTSSLNYAQRIQNSQLPTPGELRRNVNDSFIFFQPKDVVSGDFYWFEKVRRGRNEYLIIACADCTGHGVPGAIMSMMGGNQLTNIIYYQNYIEPVKILTRLDKAIKFELYRDEQSSLKQDGMEIMVCVIDLDTLEMEFTSN